MSIKNISFAMAAVVVAFSGLAIEASAGPSCNTKGGAARYSQPKVAAAKPIQAPKQVLASRTAPAVAQAAAIAAPAVEKKVSAVNTGAPVVQQQAAVVETEVAPEYTSVSGIAARLAALSAKVRPAVSGE